MLRNALLPTVTVISVQTGYLVGGLVVTETLFNYPGIGKLVLDSAIGHDLPVLQATVLLTALMYMISGLDRGCSLHVAESAHPRRRLADATGPDVTRMERSGGRRCDRR